MKIVFPLAVVDIMDMATLPIVMNWAESVNIETVLGATVQNAIPKGIYSVNGGPRAKLVNLQFIYGKCSTEKFNSVYGCEFDLTQLPKIVEDSKSLIEDFSKKKCGHIHNFSARTP